MSLIGKYPHRAQAILGGYQPFYPVARSSVWPPPAAMPISVTDGRRGRTPRVAGRRSTREGRMARFPGCACNGRPLNPSRVLRAVQALIRHVTNRPGPQALSRRHPEASPAVAQRCATPAVGTPGHQGRVASGAPSKRWPQHQVSCLPAPPGHPNPLLPTRRPQYVTVTNIVAAQGC